MRRIDVEEAAAIGAELLDRDLAGHRPQRKALLRALERRGVEGCGEGLRQAERDQHQRQDERGRQQDVERGAGQIDPEIAEDAGLLGGEATRDGGGHRRAAGGRDEVLRRQAEHLAEVRERRLAAIGLPVGVGDEGHRRVEGERRRHPVEALRVERQQVLVAQHQEQQREARRVEGEQRQSIGVPALRLRPALASEPEDRVLDRRQELRFAGEDAGHVVAERPGEPQQQGREDEELDEVRDERGLGHEPLPVQKDSGRSSALSR